MRLRMIVPALVALPMLLGGCGGAGTTSASGGAATPSPAVPWQVVAPGSATPSPVPSSRRAVSPSPPWWRSMTAAPPCPIGWPTDPQVLIPMLVTPGKGSLTVQWPAWYGPDYRVAAVDQRLVSGAQPAPTWVTVQAGGGCTVTATLSGLRSGIP